MDKAELRPLVFAVLRTQPQTQFDGVKSRLRNLTVDYQSEDDLLVHEILWELLTQGVLAPGMSATYLDLPYIHITEFGQKVLESADAQPHDPHGYLDRLQTLVGAPLDPVFKDYVTESLQTFLGGHYFASMVLLGIASEQCLDTLGQAIAEVLPNLEARGIFERNLSQAGRNVQRKVNLLRTALQHLPLPPDLKAELDVHLSGMFALTRLTRDEAGNAASGSVDRDVAYGNLLIFPRHCQWTQQVGSYLTTGESPTAGASNA